MARSQRLKAKQFMWPRYALYIGSMGTAEWHAHHMVQIVFSLDRPFQIRATADGEYEYTRGVIIPADVAHQVRVWRSRTIILWLDPEGDDGHHFMGEHFTPINETLLDQWAQTLVTPYEALDNCTAAWAFMQTVLKALTQTERPERQLDERVQAVQVHIHNHLRQPEQLAIGRLAEVVHLSDSRLMHLFRDELGLTVRRYIMWRRLLTTVEELLAGESITAAAHTAGFADAAHMNRTYKAMMGMVPSETYRNSRFVQLFSCGMG